MPAILSNRSSRRVRQPTPPKVQIEIDQPIEDIPEIKSNTASQKSTRSIKSIAHIQAVEEKPADLLSNRTTSSRKIRLQKAPTIV